MSKDQMFALTRLAWLVTTGLSWLYAAYGFSSTPRFDMWFWGVSFWLNVVMLGLAVTALALKW